MKNVTSRDIENAWKRADTGEIEKLADKLLDAMEGEADLGLDLSRALYLAFQQGFLATAPSAASPLLPKMAEALREFLSAWNQEEFAFLPLEKSARRAADLLDRYDAAVKP